MRLLNKNLFLVFSFSFLTAVFGQSGSEVKNYPQGFSQRALQSLRAEMADSAANAALPDSVEQISNVSGTGKAVGKVLKWNGSAWVPGNDSTGVGLPPDNITIKTVTDSLRADTLVVSTVKGLKDTLKIKPVGNKTINIKTHVKNLHMLNVLDYGANGNRSGSDYRAIQNAIDTATTYGRPVYFPPGTSFNIDTTLIIYYNTSLIGDQNKYPSASGNTAGWPNLIWTGAANDTMIKLSLSPAATTVSFLEISKLSLNGTSSGADTVDYLIWFPDNGRPDIGTELKYLQLNSANKALLRVPSGTNTHIYNIRFDQGYGYTIEFNAEAIGFVTLQKFTVDVGAYGCQGVFKFTNSSDVDENVNPKFSFKDGNIELNSLLSDSAVFYYENDPFNTTHQVAISAYNVRTTSRSAAIRSSTYMVKLTSPLVPTVYLHFLDCYNHGIYWLNHPDVINDIGQKWVKDFIWNPYRNGIPNTEAGYAFERGARSINPLIHEVKTDTSLNHGSDFVYSLLDVEHYNAVNFQPSISKTITNFVVNNSAAYGEEGITLSNNRDFEVTKGNWWKVGDAADESVVRSTTVSHSGSASLKFDIGTSATFGGSILGTDTYGGVETNQQYKFSGYVYLPSGHNFTIAYATVTDLSDVEYVNNDTLNLATTDTWQSFSVIYKTGSSDITGNFKIYVESTTNNDVFYQDDMSNKPFNLSYNTLSTSGKGQHLWFKGNDNVTLTYSSNLLMLGDSSYTMKNNEVLHFIQFEDGIWTEVGRR